MYQAQGNEHKFEIERLNGEIKEKKRELFEVKRRDQLLREKMEREGRRNDGVGEMEDNNVDQQMDDVEIL